MGPIVGLDTSVFIYHLEQHPEFGPAASALLTSVEKGEVRAVFSVVGMIELLTGPKLVGRKDIAAQYKQLISTLPNLVIHGIDEAVVDLTSDLRASYHLRTPDAIHLATAISAGADQFITNDRHLTCVQEIAVRLISAGNKEFCF